MKAHTTIGSEMVEELKGVGDTTYLRYILQNLSYETDIPNWQYVYEKNSILYCTDIEELDPVIRSVVEPQGIKSMLHCAIMDQGVYRGFVGFDECTANCFWTRGQMTTLQSLAEMLAVFLVKQRTLDRLKRQMSQ